ncbi:PLP-dependent aminotransferase family protein [Frigoriflavimonas asaccharolytica]|uniref:Cystathionine beta-lyase/cystathionine gamma-synthase n=1 Tax=Frigoriflavimonas asaccharolytica TaxID=2735899 RepID=A0A8J8K7B2_9FLAO|nr:PLP-dependent transferase [Frigoriflavimonas asaccharolytica]NRS91321.1 cystathionine beta-lyase/cystathionine gamma-synthase [Frigoriflavimonas asaccharolytica]
MSENNVKNYIENVIKNMPKDWLYLTTHRLDIYDEKNAKTDFLNKFENLFEDNNFETSALNSLPTAYDYIRLGHPLSCILEWAIAKQQNVHADHVITFDSQTMPILAILRTNKLQNKKTQIFYTKNLPESFNEKIIKEIYDYEFDLKKIESENDISNFDGSTIFFTEDEELLQFSSNPIVDFFINNSSKLGSILLIKNEGYVADIQHVRRRETVAMTPSNSLIALQMIANSFEIKSENSNRESDKKSVINSINQITGTKSKVLVATSGLSMQYAIMMGLVHEAQENHPGKSIKLIVPPNCYGGTNDQARRIAEAIDNVEVVDLLVDGDNEMVQSLDIILENLAKENAVPYIIAEIPTNPRVEVPNLEDLKAVLSKKRTTSNGEIAIDSVFILDQTFCPNYQFLGEGEILSTVRSISYASGSKFPSGGKCTAGYVVGNAKTDEILNKIELHLNICDNEATDLQYEILAKQLPSMLQRIDDAYKNTREFVNYIHEVLPSAKINFVSEELAEQGFTPSVFSLDLPTKGETKEEKDEFKKELNLKLINLMITKIPNESKFCVSYGQLKGLYWTVPATSTQGTTKEGDKDYIVRASLSPDLDLELHKKVFLEFVESL